MLYIPLVMGYFASKHIAANMFNPYAFMPKAPPSKPVEDKATIRNL